MIVTSSGGPTSDEGARRLPSAAATVLGGEAHRALWGDIAHLGRSPDGGYGKLLHRRFVHKTAASEVLILDGEEIMGNLWRFSFEIPRGHVANGYPVAKHVPLLLGLELVRQSGIAVAHFSEKIPLDWRFLLRSITFSWAASAPTYTPFEPFRGTLDVMLTTRRFRRGVVAGLLADVRLTSQGTDFASGSGDIDFLTPKAYRAVRRASSGFFVRSVDPPLLDMEVAPNAVTATLGIDTDDPFVFDHDSDHVPGMLLAKAAVHAHKTINGGSTCEGISMQCHRFAELHRTVRVSTRRDHPGSSTTKFVQDGDLVAQVTCNSGDQFGTDSMLRSV